MLAVSFLIESSSKLLVTRTGIKARSSSILGRIRPLILELLALAWRKCHTFETWISLKPVGQSRSNFMCSIIGVGERLHKVLGQIGSKLLFPWQQKAPIDLQWRKWCLHLFSVVFDPILFILAGTEDMHKISDECEFRPDWTTDYGVSCPWGLNNFPFIFDWIIIKVAGNQNRHKSSGRVRFRASGFHGPFICFLKWD